MSKLKSLIAAAALTATSLVAIGGNASAAPTCVVSKTNQFVINANNTVTGHFLVNGAAGCTAPVTVMTWYADSTLYPKTEFYTTQRVYDVQTKTLGIGAHTMTVKLPMCSTDPRFIHSYQADIVATGNPAKTLTAPSQGGFYYQKQVNGSPIVVNSLVGPGKCPEPHKDPPVNPPVTPVTPENPTTPKAADEAPAPEALPQTGPADTAAAVGAVTIGSGLIYRVVSRRRGLNF